MLQRTRGIALKVTNYSENSVVAQIYTEELGLQSYLINGAKKPKAKIHINMLQPLHLLDMVVYVKNNGTLQRIKEAQPAPMLQEIPLNISKSTIAMFLNEVLYKILKQQTPDPHLFHFIYQSIIWLDQTPNSISNFHLSFLMKLSKFLGYIPTTSTEIKPFFNLEDGVFTKNIPAHSNVLQEPHTTIFHNILNTNYEKIHLIQISKNDRAYLLSQVINFYKLHNEGFTNINSIKILEEVFN